MSWAAIDFICREAGLQLKRERLIAIATISTVAVLLFVLGAIVLFLLDVRLWTYRLGQELEVRAYFRRDFPRAQALEATRKIARWAEVRRAEFVSKEAGWKWLQTRLAGSRTLRGLDNPLTDGVRVQVREPALILALARRLERVGGVNTVVPSAKEAGRPGSFIQLVLRAKRGVAWAAGVVSALVALSAVFIVHNTIRLALHTRWREIYIMQLIGATRALIAGPFLLEGAFHGILGAAIACCFLIPGHMYLRSLSAHSAPFLLLTPDLALWPFGACLLAAGTLLGLSGSALSVRRYLERKPAWHG